MTDSKVISPIEVDNIQINRIPNSPKGHVGFATFIINKSLKMEGVAIYQKLEGGYRLVYPDKILRNGRKIELICPITKEAGRTIEKAVTEELEKGQNDSNSNI